MFVISKYFHKLGRELMIIMIFTFLPQRTFLYVLFSRNRKFSERGPKILKLGSQSAAGAKKSLPKTYYFGHQTKIAPQYFEHKI